MEAFIHSAGRHLRIALTGSLERLPKPTFVRAWCAMAYLHPGLHPDGYESADSGWPCVLRRFATEAWRRADAGELTHNELYCHQPCKTRLRRERANFPTGPERGSVSRSTAAGSETLKSSVGQREGEAAAGHRPAVRDSGYARSRALVISCALAVRECCGWCCAHSRGPSESVGAGVHPWQKTSMPGDFTGAKAVEARAGPGHGTSFFA